MWEKGVDIGDDRLTASIEQPVLITRCVFHTLLQGAHDRAVDLQHSTGNPRGAPTRHLKVRGDEMQSSARRVHWSFGGSHIRKNRRDWNPRLFCAHAHANSLGTLRRDRDPAGAGCVV